jgi:hypothetical protein
VKNPKAILNLGTTKFSHFLRGFKFFFMQGKRYKAIDGEVISAVEEASAII